MTDYYWFMSSTAAHLNMDASVVSLTKARGGSNDAVQLTNCNYSIVRSILQAVLFNLTRLPRTPNLE